jgi:predicted RNA binding protein YcfA (HicA-like mRNA interferase family)
MESQQTFPASFGELLKTFRKRKRLTQKQLAQHLSVHANTISSWELGTYLPATRGRWYLARVRGDHRHYKHPTKKGIVTVSGHPGKDMPVGTLLSVLKQAHIEKEE